MKGEEAARTTEASSGDASGYADPDDYSVSYDATVVETFDGWPVVVVRRIEKRPLGPGRVEIRTTDRIYQPTE